VDNEPHESELVKVGELPDSLFASVSARLSHFTIAFIKITPSRDGDDAELLGSGVLVKVSKAHAILTAAHVLPLLPTSGPLCILLQPTRTPHLVDAAGVVSLRIARGKIDAEDPDLGAVILAPPIASALAAKKSFVNLEARREAALSTPSDLRNGVWALQGWVNERTSVIKDDENREKTTRFYNFTGFGGSDPAPTVDGYDYFDFVYERRSKDLAPHSWGGVSGGGLWQIALKREGSTIVDTSALLSGIAFFQDERSGTPFSIRCHARRVSFTKSLTKRLLDMGKRMNRRNP
jgi:hypothetical protein